MKRRDVLRTLTVGIAGIAGLCAIPDAIAGIAGSSSSQLSDDAHIRDYLNKMANFNSPHENDVKVDKLMYRIFESTLNRLKRLQETAGHGNFQILSLDEALEIARRYPDVGEFSKAELRFMEMLFYADAGYYGFFGKKPLAEITSRINNDDVEKIPYTGNYIFRGEPLNIYNKIKQQLGDQVVLTSGIRNVMKQFLLFLEKAYENDGNLSLASRSLAPPGYSFHSNGDFDVGQEGYGSLNFTDRFTETEVYKKLCDLGYLKLRYPQQNLLGVRFEPWHIKISPDV